MSGRPPRGLWDRRPASDPVDVRRHARRPYSHAERLEHERLVAAHVAAHGNVCPACGSTNVKLTVDHEQPVSRGGAAAGGPKRIVCDLCNKRRGARMGKAGRRRFGSARLKGAPS